MCVKNKLLINEPIHQSYMRKNTVTFFIKNKNFEYINDSGQSYSLIGLKKKDDILGATDYDIKTPAVELAEEFRYRDRLVFTSDTPVRNLVIAQYQEGLKVLFSQKERINANEMAANIWELPKTSHAMLGLNTLAMKHFTQKINVSYQLVNKIPNCSQRESVVLFYLLRGHSTTSIGNKVYRSKRTIESQCQSLKGKFKCDNLTQLIELCTMMGYHEMVPDSILPFFKTYSRINECV